MTAALTVMTLLLPVIELLTVSVAVSVWLTLHAAAPRDQAKEP
jgi:hypothetical protein